MIGDDVTTDIWHIAPDKVLTALTGYDFIIPMERKPRNYLFILEG